MKPHNPFNGDRLVGEEIRRLIKQFGVKSIIETGTWSGHTTREFTRMGIGACQVFTIDPTWEHLHKEFGPYALEDLNTLGIVAVLGDSGEMLSSVILRSEEPILFYLDSHGGSVYGDTTWNVNPIKEELYAIAMAPKCRDSCVICIHDFEVPGKPWGYNGGDWGQGWQHLNYELVEPYLKAIYPKGLGYHYNEEAEGMQRGLLYAYPKL